MTRQLQKNATSNAIGTGESKGMNPRGNAISSACACVIGGCLAVPCCSVSTKGVTETKMVFHEIGRIAMTDSRKKLSGDVNRGKLACWGSDVGIVASKPHPHSGSG